MELKQIDRNFSVCKIKSVDEIDFTDDYVFLSKTDDELSLVCDTSKLPKQTTHQEHDWKALKIQGILDFSMVGVIAKISNLLAKQQISIFVISTYNTDYILVKTGNYDDTITLLRHNGYTII